MQKPTKPPVSLRRATIQELLFWRNEIDTEIAIRDERYNDSQLESHLGKNAGKPKRDAYRNPDNQFERWGGRGKRPGWVRKWLEAGGTLDQLRIVSTDSNTEGHRENEQ